MPISWDNGNVTIIKDLGQVWIYTRRGRVIKKARIWEIQKEKFTITYECGGSLHDLLIADIEKITAGMSSRDALYFEGNIPRIRTDEYYYLGLNPSVFKLSHTAEQLKQATANTSAVQVGGNAGTVSPGANDTIQRSDGSLVPARVTLINPTEIKYTRTDIPNSPVYTIANNSQTEIKRYSSHIKIITKN
jgi:hypothetical protein